MPPDGKKEGAGEVRAELPGGQRPGELVGGRRQESHRLRQQGCGFAAPLNENSLPETPP